MTSPLVTVGIPFFDEERWLGAAIRSVLAQTMGDFELLLLDDGSRDRSLEVARSFDDRRIRVVADGERRHLPARLNEIVRVARGRFVARMDGDDVMHPERLARQLAELEAHPGCDAVGTWAALVDEHEDVFGVIEGATTASTLRDALERGVFPHATMLARREWLIAHPYDEALTRAEDRDLWCRTVTTSSLRCLPECLYVVRVSARDGRFLPDYLAGQRQRVRVTLRYGREAMGLARTLRLVGSLELKSAVMRVAVRTGLADRIVHQRGRAATPAERARAGEALRASRQRP